MKKKPISVKLGDRNQIATKYIPMAKRALIVPCRDCGQPCVITGRDRTVRLCAQCKIAKQLDVGHYAPRAAKWNTGQGTWNQELRRLWRQAT